MIFERDSVIKISDAQSEFLASAICTVLNDDCDAGLPNWCDCFARQHGVLPPDNYLSGFVTKSLGFFKYLSCSGDGISATFSLGVVNSIQERLGRLVGYFKPINWERVADKYYLRCAEAHVSYDTRLYDFLKSVRTLQSKTYEDFLTAKAG